MTESSNNCSGFGRRRHDRITSARLLRLHGCGRCMAPLARTKDGDRLLRCTRVKRTFDFRPNSVAYVDVCLPTARSHHTHDSRSVTTAAGTNTGAKPPANQTSDRPQACS